MTEFSDPEHTPPRAPQSEFELLCADIGELKVLCARVDDRSLQMLQRQEARDSEIDRLKRRMTRFELGSMVAPTLIAIAALIMGGIALVR